MACRKSLTFVAVVVTGIAFQILSFHIKSLDQSEYVISEGETLFDNYTYDTVKWACMQAYTYTYNENRMDRKSN